MRTFIACFSTLFSGSAALASWHPVASAVTPPRSGHTAAADAEGNLWLFGGYAEYEGAPRDVTSDVWRYSTSSSVWECVQPATPRDDISRPGPRLASASAVVGNKLLIFGGWDPETAGTGGRILDDVWALDLGTLEWSRCAAPMPRGPCSRHVACTVGDELVVHTFRCLESVLVWDGTARALVEQRTSGTAPSSRGLHAAAPLGEHMLVVFGGADKGGEMCNDAFALDTRSWTWSAVATEGKDGEGIFSRLFGGGDSARPTPRAGACAAAVDATTIAMCGGAERAATGLNPRADTWALCFDDTDDEGAVARWELVADDDASGAPGPRNAASLTRLADGGLLLHGGWRPFVSTYSDSHVLRMRGGE
jgi:hypothetical protein